MTTTITTTTFQTDVLQSSKPVLVDFWAPWCGPCRQIAPVIEKLATELADSHVVAKVNVDDEPELANQFGIQGIPTLVLFHQGKVVGKLVGFHGEGEVRRFALGQR